MPTKITDLPDVEYMLSGNRACAGCGLAIAFRFILKALDGKAILTVPASCLTVLGGMYPVSSTRIPWMNCTFPSTAATASGIVAGLKALGKDDVTVVAMAGDGGTVDIGIQALSGAAERGTNFLYICYDNEAYMNTGTQRSSSTPKGVKTATTPVHGKQEHKKDMPQILEAHHVAYVATASPAYPEDLYDKVRKARDIQGTRYIHIYTPCPPGWVFATKDTVHVGHAAVATGAVVLYEIEQGVFSLTGKSKMLADRKQPLKPIEDYLGMQGRFTGLDPAMVADLDQRIRTRWDALRKRAGYAIESAAE